MSEEKGKIEIKEISMMVYRKYTEDFDSLGYRLGVTVEVKGANSRDSWYQGRLFLGKRMQEEENVIEKEFERLAKKKKRFVGGKRPVMELIEIPMGSDVKVTSSVQKLMVKTKEGNKVYVIDVDDAYHRIIFETDKSLESIKEGVEQVMKMGVTEKEALLEVAALNDINMRFNEKITISIRRIIRTSSKAVLIELYDNREVWVPKSSILGGDNIDNFAKDTKMLMDIDKWFLGKEGILGKDAEVRYDAELKKQYEGRY